MKPKDHAKRLAKQLQREGVPYHEARRIAGQRVRRRNEPAHERREAPPTLHVVAAFVLWLNLLDAFLVLQLYGVV